MTLDVSSNRFTLEIKSSNLVDSRIPLCVIKYPQEVQGETLGEEISSGQLGGINFSVLNRIENFQFSSTSAQNITVNNGLNVTQIQVPVGPDAPFRPCYLDFDGNGVVTKEDINNVFSKEGLGLMFDINGDGVVDDRDRELAVEYVGTICEGAVDPDIGNEYQGVYDILNMPFGYSLNRLLKGSHSEKPLFRVVMAVNSYNSGFNPALPGANNFVSPGHMWNADDAVYRNNTVVDMYDYSFTDIEGRLLVKDIFWEGSEQSIEDQLAAFWQQGLNIREAVGINTDPEYYSYVPLLQTLGGIYVTMVYDQSGNDKHFRGYDRSNISAFNAQPENIGKCSVGYCPIVSVWGNTVRGENGKISLAPPWGSHGDNNNPYNYSDGNTFNAASYTGLVSYTMMQGWLSPSSAPSEDFFVYTANDVVWKSKYAPFGNALDKDTFDVYDHLDACAMNLGFENFADIWNTDGTMKQEFYDMYAAAGASSNPPWAESWPYPNPRSIFWLSQQGGYNKTSTFIQTNGRSLTLFNEPYPCYIHSSSAAYYDEYINPTINLANFRGIGPKDIYYRTVPYGQGYAGGGNLNMSQGSNTWRNNQVAVTSVRSHQETNVETETFKIDIRVNNKKQLWGGGQSAAYIGDSRIDYIQPTQIKSYNGRMFYEMVAIQYTDEQTYEDIMTSVNEYFQTEELPDASITPQPI
jgi:hypothetical protein